MLPETLQSLKNRAADVQREKNEIAHSAADECWAALLAVAQSDLGPLWGRVANLTTRPHWFPRQGPPYGGQVFEAKIRVPGHREIVALYCRADWNAGARWQRSYWPGAPISDFDGRLANWMVMPAPGSGCLMTYYHTLGAALLAAETDPCPPLAPTAPA